MGLKGTVSRRPVLSGAVLGIALTLSTQWILAQIPAWIGAALVSVRETRRESSPSGNWDAVLITEDPGAMGSTQFALCLVPIGEKAALDRHSFFTARRGKPTFKWASDSTFRISRGGSDVTHYQSTLWSRKWDSTLVPIEVILE